MSQETTTNQDFQVLRMTTADAGEVLTLQRAAYVSEAQLYRDPFLPALTETLDELVAEIESGSGFVLRLEGRLVGAVRTRVVAGVLHIGRLIVAPDLQGRGYGSALMGAAESEATATDETSQLAADAAVLFTGKLSEANLRMYHRRGYVETHREELSPGVELVHMRKEFVIS
ncbi:MAG: GNAT family N-acetyltransferase [Pseudolysinimonas sp.]